ncbi:MAG TPA: DNA mismatch repair endonuclease MutL [Longimicrobiales bacterium]|nr:DNA mismatch repair endonuclease MutL [Longimicrobiales bacterium]
MSRRIHVLPDTLANQIAAGEVVERPASVVKELVENALDARATRVEVGVRNGGKTEVRVSDDGHGMGREDALLALDRHATSKIERPEDLRSVATFGFRGEALPSIASVVRLTLETAEEGGVGTRVSVNGGRLAGVEDCARQRGTTVLARSLFFNTPARAKFTRSAAVETRAVAEVMTSLALAHLSASFRLESNGRVLLELPVASDLVSRVAALWGDDFAGQLAPLSAERPGLRVGGLVQRPDRSESGPRRVHLFVGGRPFRDRGVVIAAERGYRTTVPHGARPSLLLYLELAPGGVDVNVHPAKAEVRFADRAAVEAMVEDAVRGALGSLDSAATIDARPALPQLSRRPEPITAATAAAEATASQFALFTSARPVVEDSGEPAAVAAELEDAPRPALWQVHNSYIIAETRSGLLIIDQHSAHERVMFERMMRAFADDGLPAQRLLFPITLRLSAQEYAVFDDSRGLFTAAGFEIEPFGDRTVIVGAVPAPHPYFDAERCLREMVAELAAGSELTRAAHNQHERIAMTFACKAAIKAGQKLTADEMLELFDRLFETELPSHDVHGRPTIIRLSLGELERRFGRHG